MASMSATQESYPYQNEPIWSRSEKAIARKAFDAAPSQEFHEVIQEAKRMANEIQKSSDLWDLEHHLTQRRKETDRKYDFRSSRLTDVLGRLLYENRLSEDGLRGLREDKLKAIRSSAKFLAGGRGLICILSTMAFHEKAGRSQVGSFVFSLDKVFLLPSATVATLPSALFDERVVSLGASWVFSFQPVLPPVSRPFFHFQNESGPGH